MDAYLARQRGSIPRAGLFLAIFGLLLAGCAGTSPGVVRSTSGSATATSTGGGRAHGVVSLFGPSGRVGIWPG